MDETEDIGSGTMQVGIYSACKTWALIKRRAKKQKMTISRFGELCCRRAASENGSSLPPEPPGQSLELPEEEQRRLYEDMRALSQSGRVVIHAPGGGKATVLSHELVRFLALSEREAGT